MYLKKLINHLESMIKKIQFLVTIDRLFKMLLIARSLAEPTGGNRPKVSIA